MSMPMILPRQSPSQKSVEHLMLDTGALWVVKGEQQQQAAITRDNAGWMYHAFGQSQEAMQGGCITLLDNHKRQCRADVSHFST
jgi:hypothetical protein